MGNESERGTNKSREPGDSFPINQENFDIYTLYLQCFHQRSFLKFSKKSYKFKFLLYTDKPNIIWCKSLRVLFGELVNYFMTVFIGIEWTIFAWFNEGNIIPL